MCKLIPEDCEAIYEVLKPLYLKFPNKEEWRYISLNIERLWDFPSCLGPIDGRHMKLNSRPHSGSMYHNYKGHKSMVLIGSCDAYSRFTWVNFGNQGISMILRI